MDLLLPSDGVPVLLPGDAQEHVCATVFEAHAIVPLPVRPAALHRPHVQVVSFPALPEGTHFLWEKRMETSGSVQAFKTAAECRAIHNVRTGQSENRHLYHTYM